MKWTVGKKIGAGFALATIVFIVVGTIAYKSTVQLIAASNITKHTYEVLGELDAIRALLRDAEIGQRSYILSGDEDYLETFKASIAPLEKGIRDSRALTTDNPRQGPRFDRLESLIKARIAIGRETIETRKGRSFEAALALVKEGKGKQLSDEIDAVLRELRNEEESLLATRAAASEADAHTTEWTIIFGTAIALVLSMIAGFLIARGISQPLNELAGVAEKIAGGDLSVEVTANPSEDEVGVLSRSFDRMGKSLRNMAAAAEQIADADLRTPYKPQSSNDVLGKAFAQMSANLREQIRSLVDGANVLGSSAAEIVTSTTQLATSATQTATAITETTTTAEEVRQTAQLSSQKARTVADSAQKAAQFSATGRKAAEDVGAAMTRIRQQMEAIAASMVRLSEQSQAIGQIIATVEDLSVQSNLLAVNAAIEAAKAGEHGKGFGVVAQEVKSLAEQSRQATNQVRTILGDIQKATTAAVMATEQGGKAVEGGTRQAESAGDAINSLNVSVGEAAQSATQIAASSQQQLVGVDQVVSAMENIKQASLQNVTSAKQLEGATRELQSLGARLKKIVAPYQV